MLSFHYNYRRGIYKLHIPVKFKYQSKTSEMYSGIIDTGTTYILIKPEIGDEIDLEKSSYTLNWESTSGTFKVRKAKADLIIGHTKKRQQLFPDVEIYVSEIKNRPKKPLIGRYPLFEWYNINFDNVNNKYHLIPK